MKCDRLAADGSGKEEAAKSGPWKESGVDKKQEKQFFFYFPNYSSHQVNPAGRSACSTSVRSL